MTVVLALFGGMALLLYGIRQSGEALQRAAGGRLRHLLTGLSRHRVMAVVSGAAVTAIIQSSAAQADRLTRLRPHVPDPGRSLRECRHGETP
jgi:Na+/phosphate symporter